MRTKIENINRLSNTTYHRRSAGGQKYWWLRDEDGEFQEIIVG